MHELHANIQSITKEQREEFIKELTLFLEGRGKSFTKIPVLGHKELDLMGLYVAVSSCGGVQRVIRNKLWHSVVKALGLPLTCTNAAFALRQHYLKYLKEYSTFKNGDKPDELSESEGSSSNSSSDMINNSSVNNDNNNNINNNICSNEKNYHEFSEPSSLVAVQFPMGEPPLSTSSVLAKNSTNILLQTAVCHGLGDRGEVDTKNASGNVGKAGGRGGGGSRRVSYALKSAIATGGSRGKRKLHMLEEEEEGVEASAADDDEEENMEDEIVYEQQKKMSFNPAMISHHCKRPVVLLEKLDDMMLKKYRRCFKINSVTNHSDRDSLLFAVSEHFLKQKVDPTTIIREFQETL